jgi:DNA-binding NtrC family response regulator
MDGQGKRKILIAEDSEGVRRLLRYQLEHAQYEVHLSRDGYEALGLMRKEVFNAVITDWDMPRLNGSEFLALCRIFWPKTPVVVLSAHAVPFPGDFPRGAFAWINKPYKFEELLEILGMAVQQTVQRGRVQAKLTTS